MEKPFQIYNRRRKIYADIQESKPMRHRPNLDEPFQLEKSELFQRIIEIRTQHGLPDDRKEVERIMNKVKRTPRILRFDRETRSYIGTKCKQ